MTNVASSGERPPDVMLMLSRSWQLGVFVGLVTLVLGIIVTLKPTTSLNVICVILGILVLVAGVFRLIRSLDPNEAHRALTAVLGLAFVVIGVLLIRHLHMTRTLVALIIGIVWIVQGVVDLMAGFGGRSGSGRFFTIFVGVVSLAAGIVVIAVPETSITVLTVLLGIWFIVIGLLEIAASFYVRHQLKSASP
jgi:uncharacterized membrane protein HdeD (DUF308 family)